MELTGSVRKSEGNVFDDTSVGHANKSVNLVSFNVEALLRHYVGSLLWSRSCEVGNKSERIGLCSVESIHSNVHFTSSCSKEQVMLLVEVEMTNTEPVTKCAS